MSKIGFVLSVGPRPIRRSVFGVLWLSAGSGWLSNHRARAGPVGSMPTFCPEPRRLVAAFLKHEALQVT